MQMGRVAKFWGKAPSDYARGSLDDYLLDAGIAFRMSREDARERDDAKYSANGLKLRTDFDGES